MKEQNNKKNRLDNLIVELGFAGSRSKARALIMSGVVFVDGVRSDKSGTLVKTSSKIELVGELPKFVSRGGYKLEKAIVDFNLDVKNKSALDIGASTGGFTDCLLQYGASKVYSFDVGHGQLDWKIRNDNRVIVKEKINCRYLKPEDLDDKVDIVVVDVSFISVLKVVKPAIEIMKTNSVLIALIKPQFEVGKDEMEKGGVIKNPSKHKSVVDKITNDFSELGLKVKQVIESPILGGSGNKEFLIFCIMDS